LNFTRKYPQIIYISFSEILKSQIKSKNFTIKVYNYQKKLCAYSGKRRLIFKPYGKYIRWSCASFGIFFDDARGFCMNYDHILGLFPSPLPHTI